MSSFHCLPNVIKHEAIGNENFIEHGLIGQRASQCYAPLSATATVLCWLLLTFLLEASFLALRLEVLLNLLPFVRVAIRGHHRVYHQF